MTQGLTQNYSTQQGGDAAERPMPPTGDVPIVPRSTTKMLTDEGVVTRETAATPVTQGEAPTTEGMTPQEEELSQLLDEAEAGFEAPAPNAEAPDEGKPPDFDAPEMKAFSDEFKKHMGIDLKEAFESYTQMSTQFAQTQQQVQEQQTQVAVTTLKDKWGVNDAEFNNRVNQVLAYTEKLDPDLRKRYDSIDGLDLIWGRIAAKQPTGSGVAAKTVGGDANSGDAQTFRKSELYDMMRTKPALYSSLQAKIKQAFDAGTIVDDM